MKPEKLSEQIVQNLLVIFPHWHSKLVRPFKELLNKEMSLETYYCLETLRTNDSSTMTELSRYLKVPKQQVTKLVENLLQYHFVERIYDENDRRLIRIRLTPSAIAYLDEYYRKNTGFLNGLESQLSPEELHSLNEALLTLQRILPRLS